ncbi:MAG: hypothetical protein IT305_20820 [Chloroflexi bacterium]|nr:hypothetical protein [Chloroflexota bacterium]
MSASDASRSVVTPVVEPRPAATVILVRPGEAAGIDVFMVRRDPRSRFAADVFVFPGGAVQPDDFDARYARLAPQVRPDEAYRRLADRGAESPVDAGQAHALHVAAIRETFEEAGVLLASDSAGRILGELSPGRVAQLSEARAAVQRRDLSFADLAERERLLLAPERMTFFSHWVTPPSSPRRFDTRFFVALLPRGQAASHCGIETVDGVWIAPADALERYERGDFRLMIVQVEHLRVLAKLTSVEEALTLARDKPIRTVRLHRGDVGWQAADDGGAW